MNARAATAFFLGFAGFCLCIWFFQEIGASYEDFRIPYATGLNMVDPRELSFFAWFHVLGGAAALSLTVLLAQTGLPDRMLAAAMRASERPRWYVAGAAFLALGLGLLIYFALLRGAPLSVDDDAYLFGARTLASGHLVNPAPGDAEFLQTHLVILNGDGWWSKYPIGHPLLLAIGMLAGVHWLINPLIVALCLVLTFLVARRIAGAGVAWASCLLLLTSPQFILTGATSMSQPASCACMLGAYYFADRALAMRASRDALLCGLCLGYGMLVRPLPGVLFAVGIGFYWLLYAIEVPWRQRLKLFGVAAAPLLTFGGLFLVINTLQTGGPFTTGYDVAHGTIGLSAPTSDDQVAISVGSALLRLGSWLLGWPAGLILVIFAWQRKWAVGWVLCAGVLAYRVLSRKTGLAPTGPIYVYESVPLLVMFTVDGLKNLVQVLHPDRVASGKRWLASAVLGLVTVSLLLFWPVQLQSLAGSALTWNTPYYELEAFGAKKALVFANSMVAPGQGQSWAITPPTPSPSLDDDVIFVRYPATNDAPDQALAFWKRRFGDRRAFVYQFRHGRPFLWEIKTREDFERPPWQK